MSDVKVSRWQTVAESNTIDARADIAECLAALDFGDLRHAADLCQDAAAKLRTADAFEYVGRYETKREDPAVLSVADDDDLSKLRFPVALLNRLDNAGVTTVADLTGKSERDLWRTNGIGQKFITLIKARLSLAGKRLAEDGQ